MLLINTLGVVLAGTMIAVFVSVLGTALPIDSIGDVVVVGLSGLTAVFGAVVVTYKIFFD